MHSLQEVEPSCGKVLGVHLGEPAVGGAVTNPRLAGSTEAKVVRALDTAFYSIARLFPEAEEAEGKGEAPPQAGKEEKPDSPDKEESQSREALAVKPEEAPQPTEKPEEESKGVNNKSRSPEERKQQKGRGERH